MDRAAITRGLQSLEVFFIAEMVVGILATISVFYYNFPLFALGYALLAADRARENTDQIKVVRARRRTRAHTHGRRR